MSEKETKEWIDAYWESKWRRVKNKLEEIINKENQPQ